MATENSIMPISTITETLAKEGSDATIRNSLCHLENDPKTMQLKLLAERHIKHPTSNLDTMMHIFKGNINNGILALPNSLVNSGLAFGIVGLILIGIISIHCMHLLLQSARTLCLRTKRPTLDFETTVQVAFSTGPIKLRKYSQAVRLLTSIFLCLTQLGFCCVYITFISSNIEEIVNDYSSNVWDVRIYSTIVLLPIIITCLIPNLKYMAHGVIIANILQVASLIIIFYYICQNMPPVSSRKQFSSWPQLPLWFGTAIYAFEGIGLVLPLENDMKTPQDFGGLTGVLNTGMSIVTLLFVAVAFFGYTKYGDESAGSITLNLPKTPWSEFVRAAYSVATIMSYSLQFYVPMKIMWPSIKRRISSRYQLISEMAFRTAFVVLTYALAVLIPQLSLFISLVGAFGGSYLSLIIPPILELVTYWPEGIHWPTITKDFLIIFIGFVGFGTGTYASIYQIVDTFGETA